MFLFLLLQAISMLMDGFFLNWRRRSWEHIKAREIRIRMSEAVYESTYSNTHDFSLKRR